VHFPASFLTLLFFRLFCHHRPESSFFPPFWRFVEKILVEWISQGARPFSFIFSSFTPSFLLASGTLFTFLLQDRMTGQIPANVPMVFFRSFPSLSYPSPSFQGASAASMSREGFRPSIGNRQHVCPPRNFLSLKTVACLFFNPSPLPPTSSSRKLDLDFATPKEEKERRSRRTLFFFFCAFSFQPPLRR